ncbi:YegP family protein [Arthrobacter sp. 35W]|uniref:YegP family protein n=1 Tax=Arthrobacter sp. 35W TaxID=1132441 RepID=UPI000411DA6E|nr:YegP family protein [Arthrobacter sp. 35W]
MSGTFELVDTSDGAYRVHLVDGDGQLMAVSVAFETKEAAVQGIARAREIAGTAFIKDWTHSAGIDAHLPHGSPGCAVEAGALALR